MNNKTILDFACTNFELLSYALHSGLSVLEFRIWQFANVTAQHSLTFTAEEIADFLGIDQIEAYCVIEALKVRGLIQYAEGKKP